MRAKMKVVTFSRTLALLTLVVGLLGQSSTAQGDGSAAQIRAAGSKQRTRVVGSFAEVEITLDDEIRLSDISALPRAPGSDLEVLDGGKGVRVQLPADCVEALVDDGAEIAVLRNFILVEGVANQDGERDGDVTPLGTCSGNYFYGESPLNVYIEDNLHWFGSGLDFRGVSGGYIVTCIDVHYEVSNLSWSSIVDVELSDEDYVTYTYRLLSGWWGGDGDIFETETGITAFNGKDLSQIWYLLAADYYADGYGYIDRWWIKLYYEAEEPDYCDAWGLCGYEYISNVAVGTINNSSGCTTGGYCDYTAMSTTMGIGSAYPITVVNGFPDAGDECAIWVDWNQDKDFDDAGETISVNNTPGIGPYTATITPPADANLGDTRMRIRLQWLVSSPFSCGGADDGEVEDYTLTVTSGPAKYGGGSGTSEAPYLIYTPEHMQEIGASQEDWDKHFQMRADIDLGGYTGTAFNIIGTSDSDAFTGTFDGNDHQISNFTYTCPGTNHIGIFGYVKGADADIKNLGLTNPNVDAGTGDYVGSLIGKISGVVGEDFSIDSCYVQGGSVTGRNDIGGLIGRVDGYYGGVYNCHANCNVFGHGGVGGLIGDKNCSVSNCSSSGSVSGTGQGVGGLVGRNYLNTISDSFSSGIVTGGDEMVGGLAGINNDLLLRCYSTADVTGATRMTGGLVGYNQDDVEQCYSTGNVSGNNQVGGLVGYSGVDGDISDSYSVSSVNGVNKVGGLVGEVWYSPVSKCYSAGSVTGSGSDIGGLIGNSQGGTITDCFWDRQTSGLFSSAGGTGKWTAQMQMESTFTNWDFATPIWTICEGDDYPRLWWDETKYGGGSGTAEDPYLIFTACQMQEIGAEPDDWDKHFKLMADIDLSRFTADEFNIIGTWDNRFTGVLDGNYHLISNFNFTYTVSHYMYLGIFGIVDGENAEIKNLGLTDPNIEGGPNGQIIGSLAGWLRNGAISNCFAMGGSVSGIWTIAGLLGDSWGTTTNCYCSVDVSGDDFIAGLAGTIRAGAVITNCYATGSVSGTGDHVGGLIAGNLLGGGVVANSFWDVNTTGQDSSIGGDGKTTAQMQTASTFISAGWDFVDVWKICEGIDYPKLAWEKYGGGTGASEAPYLICTPEEMQAIGANPGDWDRHFKLMADINLSEYTGTQFNIIGTFIPPIVFTGTFNGNGHEISNFTYKSAEADYVGLFGAVGVQDANTAITNLGLRDPNIDAGTGSEVGALVAFMYRDANVSDCYVEGGTVDGNSAVGGLVGRSFYGDINNCYSSASVSGADVVGGLVGINYYAVISKCYSSADILGDTAVGGLMGVNNFGTITDSYSQGNVTSTEAYVGGLVGWNQNTIANCYAASCVDGNAVVGGLAGYNAGDVNDSFWDVNSSGQASGAGAGDPCGISGKTTAQMQMESTFTNWDFVDIWDICEGTNYPKLTWQVPMTGDFLCPDGVDMADFSFFAAYWGRNDCEPANGYCDGADTDQDGDVDWLDLKNLADNWLAGVE